MSMVTGRYGRACVAALLVALAGQAVNAQTTVTWTGGAGDGNYSNPANWSPAVVPVNNGSTTYNVVIPFVSGRSTIFVDGGTPSDINVQDFTLADNVTLVLNPNRRFTVRDDAVLNGVVDARGAGTVFNSGTAVSSSSRLRLRSRDQASVLLRASSFSTSGTNFSETIFLAENNARIELDGTTQFLYGAGSGRHTHTLAANLGGTLDLTDLTVLASVSGEDDVLNVSVDESSSVLLGGLQIIQANGNGNDYVRLSMGRNVNVSAPVLTGASRLRTGFTQNGAFSAPSLTSLVQSQVSLTGSQAFNTGNLANIDSSVFSVSGGATFGSSVTATTYRSDGWYEILWNDATLFAADGAGSTLAMNSLQNIRFGHGNGRRFQYITADNSGTVSFNGLTSITTFDGEDDVLVVRPRTGGQVLLPSLATINMTGNTNNYVDFQPGAGVTQLLPALTTASQTYFSTALGGAVNAPNMRTWIRSGMSLSATTGTVSVGNNLDQADDTYLWVAGGRTFSGVTDPSVSFHWRPYGYNLYVADGAGSALDLSGIGGLRLGAGGGYHTHTISATNSGTINLAGMSSIVLGVGAEDDVLNMNIAGGGSINLAGLASVTSAGNGNDYLLLTAAQNHVYSMPGLTSATRLRTALTGPGAGVTATALTGLTQSVITLGAGQFFNGGTTIAQFDHSTVNVSGGATFGGVTDTAYRSDAHYRGLWSGATIFSADGVGSAVNLPTIQDWVFGHGNGDLNYYVTASNGGSIDLSGLRTLSIFSGQDDDLYFQIAASGGEILLTSLEQITLAGNVYERVQFDIGADQTLDLPAIRGAQRTYVNIGAGATFTAPQLAAFTQGVFTLSGGEDVSLGALTSVDGSIFRVSGGSRLSGIADTDYNYNVQIPPLFSGATLFSAEGVGSVLDASGIVLLRNGQPGGRNVFTVSATNGGLVDLTGLVTITPIDGQDDILNFVANTGGEIRLAGLRNINQANTGNGNDYVQFSPGVDTTISTPALLNARRIRLSMPAGSVLDAPAMSTLTESYIELNGDETFNHGTLAQIDGSVFNLSGGVVFNNVSDTSYSYNTQYYGLWSGATVFSAAGTGTRLELPTLSTMINGQPGGRNVFTVSASGGGHIDLSGLTTINPVAGEDDILVFSQGTGGTIDLAALSTVNMSASGNGNDYVQFSPGAGSTLSLPALTAARRTKFLPAAGVAITTPALTSLVESTVVLGLGHSWNAAGITNLDATQVRVTSGGSFIGGGDALYEHNSYIEPFLATSNIALWTADGVGSVLDLSGVREFRLGWDWGNHTFRVSASGNALIDLSGLERITMRSGQDDDLAFDIASEGTIDLSSLQTINVANGNGNQTVTFNVGAGQTLNLPSLTSFNSTFFNLGVGATLNAPSMQSVGFWSLTLTQGREYNFGGLTNIDNSQFHVREGVTWGTSTGDVLATTYSTTGYRYANFSLFSAANPGSVLDLSSLESLNLAWNDQDGTAYASTISATDGGRVDLSGVVRLTSPARGEDRIDFVQTTGGSIDLSSLEIIEGAGRTRFTGRDGLGYVLPNLTRATGLELDLTAGSDFSAPSLVQLNFSGIVVPVDRSVDFGGLTNLDNSQIINNSNAAWGVSTGDVAATTYSTTGHRYGNFTYFAANGAGSVMDLSTIQTMDFGWNDQDGAAYAGTISASVGGVVDLSGLQTIVTPARGEDRVDFVVSSGGRINLDSLTSVSGAGQVRFAATDGADFALPALATLRNARFDLSAGSVLSAPVLESLTFSSLTITPERTFDFGGVGNIDNSDLHNSSGAAWGVSTGDIDAISYSRTGHRYGNGTIFSATNAGSVLDLSSVQTANFGWDDQDGTVYVSVISATVNGVVNLNGLTTLTAPARGEDRLDLNIASGGRIQLNNLTTVGGGGRVRFSAADGGDFALPALTTTSNTDFILSPGSDLIAPNLSTMNFSAFTIGATNTVRTRLVNANNSQIYNNSGREWGASTGDFVATTYATNGYRYGNFSYFSASGGGSVLDLSTLSTIDASWNDQDGTVYAGNITATDAGRVNLSRLRTIIAPARGEDRIDFIASNDGEMNFGSIRTIGGGGQVRFAAQTGGSLAFSDLYLSANATLAQVDADSMITINRTLFMQGGSVQLAPNATLNIEKHFYNQNTVETTLGATSAIIAMNGSGIQFLEVGGLDLGPVTPGNNGNFGFGQLLIGSVGNAVSVQLLDVYDNGNRGQRVNEALYLFGLGGPDGLVLRGGSTLFLDNLSVYARENGRWVHLNSLFGPGDSVISYSGGFLHLPSPGALGLLGGLGMIAARRRR
jgi:hypothetical protein